MTNPDREELVKINEAGLEAAVRECARITAPDISDDEYERIKDDNSPRYQKTREEMAQTIRAYLRTIKPAVSTIVTCCITGAIPGDGGACGDCDPCLLGEASVPSPVKRLIAEKNSLLHRIGELEDELGSLRSLASSDGGVKVRDLEWCEYSSGGCEADVYSISNTYRQGPRKYALARGSAILGYFDEIDAAKAAAQADYEARIKSALVEVPAVNTAPPADAGLREAYSALCLPRESQASDNLDGALYDIERLSAQGKPTDDICIRTLKRVLKQIVRAEQALTAPGATTKSDGGAKAGSSPILASKEDQRTMAHGVMLVGDNADASGCTGTGPSDPSSTRSEVTALADIAEERRRQRDVEGWTVEHDDGHATGEMAGAAACYALSTIKHWAKDQVIKLIWPWASEWWKPKDHRRNLVKAGALIVAEIERLDRLDQFEIRRK